MTTTHQRLADRAAYVAAATQLIANGYKLEAGCYEEDTSIRPQIVANRDGVLVILRWNAHTDADVNHYGPHARREANMAASALIFEAADAATPPQPSEIARLATLVADTQVWLSQCPIKADGFYETAEYTLQSIVDEIVEAASAAGLDEIVESINTAQEEGEYPDDDEVAFWRHIAAIVA